MSEKWLYFFQSFPRVLFIMADPPSNEENIPRHTVDPLIVESSSQNPTDIEATNNGYIATTTENTVLQPIRDWTLIIQHILVILKNKNWIVFTVWKNLSLQWHWLCIILVIREQILLKRSCKQIPPCYQMED